jgi:hypothetical protein
MKTLKLLTLLFLLVACSDNITEKTVISDSETVYDNEVTLIFSLKGEYTMYDIETGALVYSRYKDKSVWLGEGYDTVNITAPDTVITYRYDYKADDMTVNTTAFSDSKTYQYLINKGWDVKPEGSEGVM